MDSAYKLNKRGANIQPWDPTYPILNQFIVPCPVLTVVSWSIYRFLRRQVRLSGIPISLRIFQFAMIHTAKGFSIVKEAEVNAFMAFISCFYDRTDVGYLILGSSAFFKYSLYIWKFLIHIFFKPCLKSFEHHLASIWNECSCIVVWAFFGIAFHWDWNENWPFPVLWSLLSFPNLVVYSVQHFYSTIFQDLK